MPQAPRVSAVLWDLDGTLVDTEHLHAALERRVLNEVGVPEPQVAAMMSGPDWVGLTTSAAFERGLGHIGREDLLADALALLDRRLVAEVLDRAQPKQGVNRVLLDIPMRETRFAIVTSSRRSSAEALVERFGWGWRFETLVTADDVAQPKPHAEPYRQALERMGLDRSSALAVEDSPNGIAAARAAGLKCAAVVGTFQPDSLSGANWVVSGVGAVQGLLSLMQRKGDR